MKEIIKKLKNKVIIGNIITIGITIIVIKLLLPIIGQEVIEVTFESQANKNITYQLFYTSMPDEKFNGQKSLQQQIKAGKQSVKFSVPTQNMEQLRIDFGQVPEKASISHLKVNGKEIKALEFKNIINYHQIEKHEITNNQLTIYSREGDPFIVFPKNLNIKPIYHINWYLFSILLILVYFTLNGIIKYLLNMKKGKINYFGLIFILCFFGSLFIPMMKISNETVSDWENRTLAKKPTISIREILKEKSEYGKAFENWFNDHFFGRNQMMIIHDEIRNKVNRIIKNNKAIYFKNNHWMFNFPFVVNCSQNMINPIIQNLKKFNAFCQENNIKLYVLMRPRKEGIYQEWLYNYGFDKKKSDQAEQVYRIMQKEAQKINIPFVYPLKELQQAKQKDYVFFKLSHHWTDWGAYIAYQGLMKEIQKDFSDIPVMTLNDYNKSQNKLIREGWNMVYWKGYLEPFFHLKNDEANSVNYTYYDHKNKNLLQIKSGQYIKDFSYPSEKYRIMVIGDSTNDHLMLFIPYSANELKFIRVNLRKQSDEAEQWKIMKLYKKDILAFKPDILILSFTDNISWKLSGLSDN